MFFRLVCLLLVIESKDAATNDNDSRALEAFRAGVGDPEGALRTWEGLDPCGDSWEGVACRGENVLQLLLARKGLVGTVPSELGRLAHLQMLVLNGNSFTGAIPHSLGNLTELRYLWLDSNYFTGFVPEEALYNLEELTDLNLQSNPVLCGALDVSRLPENATLDLSDTLINQECPAPPPPPFPSHHLAHHRRPPLASTTFPVPICARLSRKAPSPH
ncbi:hypothetical protein CYMTET_35056 [Cymbomonas tetramitiformis]|uniref:Leucine-rich repeat-containing N-terminal plant-type domain-containing protein n=1 Tax=Cymbomonas tetramitiformis TaxID=36881 RepID=A0AAE0KPC4_9CHLO|nr:hypothetical protein CYMTET_35056 [Cymbomonas tetramitiformis]